MISKNARGALLISASIAAIAAAMPACAQDGIALGSFTLLPRAEVIETYNDNVYTSKTDEHEDWITSVQPNIALRSNFSEHSLNFSATGDLGYYASDDGNNYQDFALSTDGRFDATPTTKLEAAAAYRQNHEDRGSRENRNGTEPQVYQITTLTGAVNQNVGDKVLLRADVKHNIYSFNDVERTGSTPIKGEFRDRTETTPGARAQYSFNQNIGAFVRGYYTTRDYDKTSDLNGFKRSSEGYSTDIGMGIGYPGVFSAEVYVGYLEQKYDDNRLGTVDAVNFGWNVEYIPMPRVAVRSYLSRSIDETTTALVPAIVSTNFGLSADIDVARNLIARPEFTYSNSEYQVVDQTDNVYGVGLGLAYSLTDNLYVGPAYKYRWRDSNVSTNDFSQSQIMLRLGGQI